MRIVTVPLKRVSTGRVPTCVDGAYQPAADAVYPDDHRAGLRQIERDAKGVVRKVWLSSLRGDGRTLLLEAIAECLGESVIETSITLGPSEGRLRAQFFALGAVLRELPCEDGSIEMHLKIQESSLRRIARDRPAGAVG